MKCQPSGCEGRKTTCAAMTRETTAGAGSKANTHGGAMQTPPSLSKLGCCPGRRWLALTAVPGATLNCSACSRMPPSSNSAMARQISPLRQGAAAMPLSRSIMSRGSQTGSWSSLRHFTQIQFVSRRLPMCNDVGWVSDPPGRGAVRPHTSLLCAARHFCAQPVPHRPACFEEAAIRIRARLSAVLNRCRQNTRL